MSTGRSRGDPACSWRGRTLDYLHRTAIDFDSLLQPVRLAATLSAADDRVDAEADLRLGWHRNDWRRRERHHRTIIVRFPGGQPTLTGPTDLRTLNRRDYVSRTIAAASKSPTSNRSNDLRQRSTSRPIRSQ